MENNIILTDRCVHKEFGTIAEKIAAFLRGITTPPIIAFMMLTYFYLNVAGVFDSFQEFLLAVFFISLLPAMAYPFQYFVRNSFPGQDGKRTLAMIFSVTGYVLGLSSALIMGSNIMLILIYLGYCISGAVILILSKVIKFRISGHAVGSAGPVAILMGFGQWVWVFGIPVILSVIYSSLKIKRHTRPQIICGIIQPFVVFMTLISILKI